MHASPCHCPHCQATREATFESESFEYEASGSTYGELESPLTETEEVELALELLAVASEAEMDQFLGKMFKGIWKGVKKVGSVVGKIAKPLGGILKGIAKKALPFVGGALGSFIPIPGVGTAIGSALGGALSKTLEVEYGELNAEEAEFELARRFVRIAATAAQRAAALPPDVDPETAVTQALVTAARSHLPYANLSELEVSLVSATSPRMSGRWIRQGRSIMILGA